MIDENGIIRRPVDLIADVYRKLGISADNGNYSVDLACRNTHGKINKWSRCKPIRLNKILVDRGTQWWKGKLGRCGLEITVTGSYRDIANMYRMGNAEWGYEALTALAYTPRRLGDFEGYDHEAQAPILGFTVTDKAIKGTKFGATCLAQSENPTDTGVGSLRLSDITILDKPLSEWYFGIAVYRGTTYVGRVTSASPGDLSCEFSLGSLAEDTYTAYPFLAELSMVQSGADPNNHYVALPNVKPKSVQVCSATDYYGLTVVLQGRWRYSLLNNKKEGIDWSFSIKSDRYVDISVSIRLRFSANEWDSPMQNGELKIMPETGTSENINLTPGEAKRYSGRVTSGYDSEKSYALIAKITTPQGVIYSRTNILEQDTES